MPRTHRSRLRAAAISGLVCAMAGTAYPQQASDPRASLGEALAPLLAEEARLDQALADRARAAGAVIRPGVQQLEEDQLRLFAKGSFGARVDDFRAPLRALGLPPDLLERAVVHEAWRRATAEAILRATRPAPDEAVLQRLFENKFGPGGVRRRYEHVLISTDALASTRIDAAEMARERETVRSQAQRRAEEAAASITAALEAPATMESRPVSLESAVPVLTEAGRAALERSAPGAALVLEGRDAWFAALVERKIDEATLEGVRIQLSQRPGETDPQFEARARAAAAAFAAATDPSLYSLDNSDGDRDRRDGGVIRCATGGARLSGPASTDVPPAVVESLASLAEGQTTPLVPFRKGYVAARLVKKTPTGRAMFQGRAVRFGFDDTAIRASAFGPRMREGATARARAILERVRAGGRISDFAAESEDAEARKPGGCVTWSFGGGSHGADFMKRLEALRAEDGAVLLESKRGVHVIRLFDQTRTSYEEVRPQLLQKVMEAPAARDEIDRLIAALRG